MENSGPANHFCSLDSKWNVIKIAVFTALQHEPGPWLFPECRLNEEAVRNAVNAYVSWVHTSFWDSAIVSLGVLTPALEHLVFPGIYE